MLEAMRAQASFDDAKKNKTKQETPTCSPTPTRAVISSAVVYVLTLCPLACAIHFLFWLAGEILCHMLHFTHHLNTFTDF